MTITRECQHLSKFPFSNFVFDTVADLIFSITVGNDIHSKTGPGEFLDNLSEYETSFRKPFKIWAEKALPVPGTQFQIRFDLYYNIYCSKIRLAC